MKNKPKFSFRKCSIETRAMLLAVKVGLGGGLFTLLYRPIRRTLTTVSINHFLSTTSIENAKMVMDDFVEQILLGDYGFFANSLYHINFWSALLSIMVIFLIFLLLAHTEKKLRSSNCAIKKTLPQWNEVR